jgi:hypothetical protein
LWDTTDDSRKVDPWAAEIFLRNKAMYRIGRQPPRTAAEFFAQPHMRPTPRERNAAHQRDAAALLLFGIAPQAATPVLMPGMQGGYRPANQHRPR